MGLWPILDMLCYDGVAIDQLVCPDQMAVVNGQFKCLQIEFTLFIYVKIFFTHVMYKIADIFINGSNKIYIVIV